MKRGETKKSTYVVYPFNDEDIVYELRERLCMSVFESMLTHDIHLVIIRHLTSMPFLEMLSSGKERGKRAGGGIRDMQSAKPLNHSLNKTRTIHELISLNEKYIKIY